jgi:hypothetical protein
MISSYIRNDVPKVVHPMTKTVPTKYNEQDVRTRFDRTPNKAPGTPRRPLLMTATMKRRALKKKPGKP